MRKFNYLFIITFLGTLLTACDGGGDYQTTDSGIKYKYISKGGGEEAKPGEVMILNMVYKDGKDTVLFSTLDQGDPMPMPVDSTWKDDGSIYEVFRLLKKGDSVEIKITAEGFYIKTARQPLPDSIDAKSLFTFNIGVEDVMAMDSFRTYQMKIFEKQQERAAIRAMEQLKKDKDIIENYLKENNIEAQSTESGLRYVVLEEGKGPQASQGDSVVVDFTGSTLDGKMFYTSNRKMAEEKGVLEEGNPYEPLSFVIGAGRMIPGVEEGISLLKEGSKARLYLPSEMAYGERGAGPDIKPNQVLSFDVELIDIKNK